MDINLSSGQWQINIAIILLQTMRTERTKGFKTLDLQTDDHKLVDTLTANV